MIFSIGNNVFSDIISNFGDLIDGSTMKLSDIDLEFVSTKAGGKKNNQRNPERALIRFQMMEIFTRIALTKYFKTGDASNQLDAIKKMFEKYIEPFIVDFDCHKWRGERLWNEKCDHVYKRYLKPLKEIYLKYSGKYATPSASRFMSLDEFFDCITQAGVVDETFGQREIGICYNLSMMTQKDEIDKDRHLNMVFVEFIEGLGRVADKLSLPPFFDNMDGVPPGMETSSGEMTATDRKLKFSSLPLHVKIETLIMMIIGATVKKDTFNKIEVKMRKFHLSQTLEHKTKFIPLNQPYMPSIKPPADVDFANKAKELAKQPTIIDDSDDE